MKIRMLTHFRRAADGIHVAYYNGGEKYDLPDGEARLFISVGVAVEDKDMGGAPETKEAPWVSQDNYAPIYAQTAPPERKTTKKRR